MTVIDATKRFDATRWPVHCIGRAICLRKVALGLWLVGLSGAAAQSPDNYRLVDGLAVYIGVVPAAIVGEHAVDHPEGRMHGGAPQGTHVHHLVVAVFDDASGQRIEDADLVATISGLGHIGSTRIALEPMLIADVVTYGGYVSFPGTDRYAIDLEISRKAQTAVVRVQFVYEHFAP